MTLFSTLMGQQKLLPIIQADTVTQGVEIAKAMSALPVGFAYSTYSGLTVTGVVLFAVLKFNQIPNIYGIIGIILIIIGVVMVNYLGRIS